MGSKKQQAKAKQQAQFKAGLGASNSSGHGLDDLFYAEERRGEGDASAAQKKACLSKNRYDTREDAEEAVRTNTHAGRKTLRVYHCDYCDGWHLTSKPPR